MISSAHMRPWHRLHWSTCLALLVVGSALVQCHIRGNVHGAREFVYFGYGWPLVHPDNDEFYISNAFFLNLVAGTLMLLSTGFVFERCSRTPGRLTFQLSTSIHTVAIVAVLLGLVRWQEQGLADGFAFPVEFIGRRVLLLPTPIEHQPWYVGFPILFGLGFTMYSTWRLAGRIWSWLVRGGKVRSLGACDSGAEPESQVNAGSQGTLQPETAASLIASIAATGSAACRRTPVSKESRIVIVFALLVHFDTQFADRTVAASDGSAQEEATPAEPVVGDRVLRFPADRAMGVLYFRNAAEDHSQRADWRRIGLATSEVPVPVGQEVRLDLSAAACKDLSPLHTLRPDDLRMLYVRAADLDAQALASIGHLTGLHRLDFSSCNLRDSDTKYLAKLVSLKSVLFQSTPVGDAGMANLAPLERLLNLGLSRTRVTEKGLAHVAEIKSLKSVSLSYSDIGDQGLEHLGALTSLEDLQLSSMQYVTDAGLSHVSGLTRLQSLDISETSISDGGLAHLSALKELRVLRLGRTSVTDAGLAHLKLLVSLEELILPDGISDDGLAHLATLTSLRKLTVRPSQVTDAGLAHLSRLDKLDFLNLAARKSARGRVSDRGAVHLAGLKSLRTLWLQFSDITNEGLATLAQLESLESLLLNENQITSDGLRHLARFPSLTNLNIAGLKGPAASLRHLASLERLTHLKIGPIDPLGPDGIGTEDSDEGLGYLAELQKLQSLELGHVPITDRGLKHLSGLHSLHRLDLTNKGNTITDDGLVHLANMQKLEYLLVRGAITDRGLEHLAKLGSLRFVAIQCRTISELAIETLKQRVPSLQEVTKITRPLLKNPPIVGEPAPNFEVRAFDGHTIRLSDLRGKAVLLYFWATWCTPCVAQTPDLKTMHEELSKKYDRFEMISLSLDEDDHLARRHVERFGLKWPQAWIGLDSPICAEFGVESSPRYVLIDPEGKMAILGHDGKEIKNVVAKMLD